MTNTKFIIGALVVLLTCLYAYFKFYPQTNKVIGEKGIPEFSAKLINGQVINSETLKGKYVLIDFWGSWCGPCYRDIPKLKELFAKYKNTNFEILSIAIEKNESNGMRATKQLDLPWKYQVIEESKLVLLSPLAYKFGVTELPTKFLVSPEGKVTQISNLNSLNNLIRLP